MKRLGPAALLAAILMLAVVEASGAARGVRFGTSRERMLNTRPVTVRLVNHTDHRVELFGGSIGDARDGDLQVRLKPERRFLPPAAEHSWTWLHEGDAGRFVARFRTSEARHKDVFELGAYFTIAFRCDGEGCDPANPFVIWVREERPIRQLRADLQRRGKQRRIVSGIVRRAKPYNPDWSYTMGPASIVLGEVFIETCDAHPSYVENHRGQWMGERWCPWSSFVSAEGR
ncbi:MAG: hypothetical protein M3277_00870 [Actinomycetota bacterium]|nr:hypothetical protein [Actinomycetota bacterium]